MLSNKDLLRQQSGGTWTDIVKQDSWTNRFPVVAWLILIQVLGLLALPITFYIFRPLADRGYLFSKLLGVFFVCLAPGQPETFGFLRYLYFHIYTNFNRNISRNGYSIKRGVTSIY